MAKDLEALILQCLEKSRDKRPADAHRLQAALRACTDARSWSDDDARSWFATHEQTLRARQSRGQMQGTQTIAVDLGLRAADTPPHRQAG